MKLRIQELDDLSEEIYEQIVELLLQLSEDLDIYEYSYFESVVNNKGVHLFCVFLGDEVVGMATMVAYNIPSGQRIIVEDVVIDRNCRGQGLGRKLMEHVINFCRINGIKCLNLSSSSTMVATNKLYQSLGFKLQDTNAYYLELDQ